MGSLPLKNKLSYSCHMYKRLHMKRTFLSDKEEGPPQVPAPGFPLTSTEIHLQAPNTGKVSHFHCLSPIPFSPLSYPFLLLSPLLLSPLLTSFLLNSHLSFFPFSTLFFYSVHCDINIIARKGRGERTNWLP